MKIKIMNIIFRRLGYLLFLPFILFYSCQESVEESILIGGDSVVNKDSKIVSLMKLAVKNDSDDDDQCVEFKYPIVIYAIYPDSPSIELIVINNDDELIAFFDEMKSIGQISIDFPFEIIGTDDEVNMMNSLEELEGTLQIAVDACRGEGNLKVCDDKGKKVSVCHQGKTICISVNAVWTHLNNHTGDYAGKCEDDNDDQ